MALVFSLILIWIFALPAFTGTVALYGAMVIFALAAAHASSSRFFERASLVLAALYAVYNLAWFFTDVSAAVLTVPVLNGLAAIYFFWQANRKDAQHKGFHLILGVCQLATLAMKYFQIFADSLGASEVASNFWFVFAMNRLFDTQLLLVIISSRLRVHARKDLNAWREWVHSFVATINRLKRPFSSHNRKQFVREMAGLYGLRKTIETTISGDGWRETKANSNALARDRISEDSTPQRAGDSGQAVAASMDATPEQAKESISVRRLLRQLFDEIGTDD